MSYLNSDFSGLLSNLYSCLSDNITSQLEIYPQLKFLCDYLDNCIFSDTDLKKGKTYILPIDVEMDLFEEEEYEYYTDPNNEQYDRDLAPFVESHNKHVNDEFVGITLKAGTQLIYNGFNPYSGLSFNVDGYDLDWYSTLIGSDRYGNEGPVPFVIKA